MTGWSGNILRIDLDPGSPIFCLTEEWFSLQSMISDILGFSMEAHGDPWGLMGLTICYDIRFPNLFRDLAKAGAKVIFSPAAFTRVTGEAHWHVLQRARAIENGCYIVSPAQVGTHANNRKTFGHSLIVNPWGEVLADGGTETGFIVSELDLGAVDICRSKVPSLYNDQAYLKPI